MAQIKVAISNTIETNITNTTNTTINTGNTYQIFSTCLPLRFPKQNFGVGE